MGSRDRVNQVAIYGPFTLDDLRWLVDQCTGCHGESRVEVVGRRAYSPIDHTAECITVHARPDTAA